MLLEEPLRRYDMTPLYPFVFPLETRCSHGQVSGEIDRIVIPNGRSREDITDSLQKEAIDLAHRNGAHIGSVKVVEMELLPLQYVTNDAFRAVIKAVR